MARATTAGVGVGRLGVDGAVLLCQHVVEGVVHQPALAAHAAGGGVVGKLDVFDAVDEVLLGEGGQLARLLGMLPLDRDDRGECPATAGEGARGGAREGGGAV